MEIGINENGVFPLKFKWLKGKIHKIKLTAFQGKNIEQTDIISLGKSGVLIFGEMEAEYQFNYADAKGICFIQFGFPKYYVKQKRIEFETKISKIELEKKFSHISRIKLKRDILKEFQREKHNIFELFLNYLKKKIRLMFLIKIYKVNIQWKFKKNKDSLLRI